MRNKEDLPTHIIASGIWFIMAVVAFIGGFVNPYQFIICGICLIPAIILYKH